MAAEDKVTLSVSDAVSLAKQRVASTPTLVVTGEVTGFRGPNARSGHCYFQVKDDQSAMDVIVWKGTYQHAGIDLRDGMELELSGRFDVYQRTGRLSFVARSVSVAGEGLLRQRVAELARRLEREGLMDPARKRPIPRFCTRVAVVTSLSGSVIDDVKRTLSRRNPLVEIDEVGCKVQGEGAPATIIRALAVAAAARPEAILLVRGGGSFEDLMTFNDEALARAVAACPVPVVTGIGHEPDTSICDMVADRRASTPTAAAESVAPAIDEVVETINARQDRLGKAVATMVARESQRVEELGARAGRSERARLGREEVYVGSLASRRVFREPMSMVTDRLDQLRMSEQRLHDAIPTSLQRRRRALDQDATRLIDVGPRLLRPYESDLARLASSLDALSPLKVLGRGYAIARDAEGHVISDAGQVERGDGIEVLLGRGSVKAQVTEKREGR
ncbi:MAG: exodeoxyribonuclease VII large subunit [Olsenella sp.]|uniref:Exodeoxyribonuclease 7 large subunit n=1 Tax=Olsenella absiana TaxID=3115222 RepID=A0ABU7R9J4_9ACTN|nr:exodeoxyribonuclease VII large subunit [Olsenella sp.]